MTALLDTLVHLGADRNSFRVFDAPTAESLAYSTILMARGQDDDLRLVEGVYEWQEAPLAFIVDGNRLNGDFDRLQRIRRLLAMRGDAPYLGIVQSGRLDVYLIALDEKTPTNARVDAGTSDSDDWLTFARLANLRPSAQIDDNKRISGVILKLLDQAISSLRAEGGLAGEDAISLVGRALFVRFLADRNLLPPTKLIVGVKATGRTSKLQDHELFDEPDLVRRSCAWLDRTFNGDLLPLSEAVFLKLTSEICLVLGNILRRAEGGQLSLGWHERWDNLDFSHIPVGVLSQAYEHYLRKHAPEQQHQEGGFYTPHPIANLMVSAAFRGLNAQGTSRPRILDPAAGAGVFLLAAFREMVAARWRADGKRPDTTALREILYTQIRGFDVNETALRFCALGLYLLSIELDPDPRPVDKLHFDDLRGVVLHRPIETLSDARPESKQLGSLGPLIGTEHDGQYDLVIGNPPWASATGLENWSVLLAEIHDIARSRLGNETAAPPLPNAVLDLPFVWRATRWAKPDAQIVFALHARFLFQQGDGMPLARQSIFEAIDVTSVINGSELRQTKVWPSISAPFCLLFALNRPAHTASGFRMLTPRYEKDFNNAGVMRIDASNAYIVRPQDMRDRPETLKILFRGTEADLSLIDRLREGTFVTLGRFWRDYREGGLTHGNGYQRLRLSSKERKDGTTGEDATHLQGIPHLDDVTLANLVIDTTTLPGFSIDRLHRARKKDLYRAPLLLLHKSPPAAVQRIQMSVSDHDIVFNETWYGFSAHGAPDAELLTRYFALVLGSRVAMWISLITSGEFGFEREVIEKTNIEDIPVPSFDALSKVTKKDISRLFKKLDKEGAGAWDEIDGWVARLYGLGERDLKVIRETLQFNLPYAGNRKAAERTPSEDQIQSYCRTLEAELQMFAQRFGSSVTVHRTQDLSASPWRALRVSTFRNAERRKSKNGHANDLRSLTALADRTGATELVVDEGKRCLVVMRLAQARYWTDTQARLAAQRIVWTRPDLFRSSSYK